MGWQSLTFLEGDAMNISALSVSRVLTAIALMAATAAVYAQTAPSDFTDEPDKSMAAAHEAFVKGDKNEAAADLRKASASVKKAADEVAKDAKAGVNKAAADLDKLAKGIEQGTVKSGDDLKNTFAHVDHALATAWHKTATEMQKSGKDAGAALARAGAGLEGAAKWSGTALSDVAKVGVDGAKKLGQGVQMSAEDVGKLFSGIGQGIKDVGQHLKPMKS